MPAVDVALALACAALALWMYGPLLGQYFSPDDLVYLERVRGLAPEPPTLWRFLSGRLYFHVVFPWFGLEPQPYMTVNWLLHGLNAALLYACARAWGGGQVAGVVAGGLFAASRLFVTVVGQAVTVSELLGTSLWMLALIAALRPGVVAAVGAAMLFLAALLAKENVLLMPLLLLLPRPGAPSFLPRLQRTALLLAPSALVTLYVLSVRGRIFSGSAYEAGLGSHLFHNLMQYAEWSVDLAQRTPDLFTDITTRAWPTGLVVILALLLLWWYLRRVTSLPLLGACWWLLGLLPVLPLLRQRYLHYLYLPLAGLAIAIAGSFDALAALGARSEAKRPAPGPRPASLLAWTLGLVLVVGHAAISDALLDARLRQRVLFMDLPFDPFHRKQMLARRVATRVGEHLGGRGGSIAFAMPAEGRSQPLADVVRQVLDDGRGLRAVCPRVDSVIFFTEWTPAHRDFDLFYLSEDGFVVALGRGLDARARLAALLRERGQLKQAERLAGASPAADSLAIRGAQPRDTIGR